MANRTIVDLETDLVKPYIDTKAITIEKNLAPTENGATAVGSYAIGEQFVRGDKLYRAKTAITAGDTLTLNTNYEAADDITTQVTSLKEDFISHVNANGSKNILDLSKTAINEAYVISKSVGETSSSIRVGLTAAQSWRNTRFTFQVKPNTDYRVTAQVTYTSGHGGLSIRTLGDVEIKGETVTSSKSIDYTFNSGNNTELYIVYVITGGTSEIGDYTYNNTMIRLASDGDSTYEPCALTNRQLTTDKVGMDLLSEVGAVNRLKITATSQIASGVTIAIDDDGVITTSDTATALLNLTIGSIKNLSGTYRLSGCPSGGGGTTYQLQIEQGGTYITPGDYGDGFVYNFDASKTYNIRLVARTGQNMDGKTFKPMLAPVSYNGDYVPYAMTNKELTDDVIDLSNSKQSKFTNGYGIAPAWDIVLSGGHGGTNGSRALIICQSGVAQLGFWGGAWQLAWSNLSGSSTVSASNQSASGIRLTFNDNSAMDITPIYDCEVVSITPVS